jgi:predicted HAD superfamily Cof-like phosphohydrolase
MIKMITESKDLPKETGEEYKIIADQVDSLVDMYYYALNGCVKKKIDFSSVFNVVHEANMNKRDIESGKFLKRADGKIIKPPLWRIPDIGKEILRQMGKI